MPYIEYFYAPHSVFAYIGSKKLMDICKASGRTLRHRPISLDTVIKAVGSASFAQRNKAHRKYFFGREIARWAEFREVPIIGSRPKYHSNPLDLANGMLIAAIEYGADVDALSHAILQAHWRDDADHGDEETLYRIGNSVGMDSGVLLDAALSPEIQSKLQTNTEDAIARSVFGSPTYFVDGDMFYGQDRLEQVEHALIKPFKGLK